MGSTSARKRNARASATRREAFDALYRREMAFVWRVLRYHGVPEETVEDAVQDVFVIVHRRWKDWPEEDREARPRAWLFGIARRVASLRRRTSARHERRVRELPEPAPERPLDDRAADREALAMLDRALAALDEDTRMVFMLAQLEGMTAPAIAASTGAKVNTVYWRLRTARAHVRAAMREDWSER